jgi:hypothetical protein
MRNNPPTPDVAPFVSHLAVNDFAVADNDRIHLRIIEPDLGLTLISR